MVESGRRISHRSPHRLHTRHHHSMGQVEPIVHLQQSNSPENVDQISNDRNLYFSLKNSSQRVSNCVERVRVAKKMGSRKARTTVAAVVSRKRSPTANSRAAKRRTAIPNSPSAVTETDRVVEAVGVEILALSSLTERGSRREDQRRRGQPKRK